MFFFSSLVNYGNGYIVTINPLVNFIRFNFVKKSFIAGGVVSLILAEKTKQINLLVVVKFVKIFRHFDSYFLIT